MHQKRGSLNRRRSVCTSMFVAIDGVRGSFGICQRAAHFAGRLATVETQREYVNEHEQVNPAAGISLDKETDAPCSLAGFC